MSRRSDADVIARLRDPVVFIESLIDPETGKPFELTEAQKAFVRVGFTPRPDGRLPFVEYLLGMIKKSGKTGLVAMLVLFVVLVLGGPFAEAYIVANDLQQAQDRVYQAICRIILSTPWLRNLAKVTQGYVEIASTGATIQAIASDYTSAAGANPTIVTFDELWGYTSEASQRLWDELVPVPTRRVSVGLTSTYAGFTGESELLEKLYARGLRGEQVAPSLYAQPGMLMAWHHEPTAPWQTQEWLDQMREQLRPNAYLRMIENRFVSSESTFIPMEWWDACTDPDTKPIFSRPALPVWIGLDASLKRDSTALVAVTLSQAFFEDDSVRESIRFNPIPQIAYYQRLAELRENATAAPMVHLVNHRIFRPRNLGGEIDFELTIERTLYEWAERYTICGVLFDPFQMVALSQRLQKSGFAMFPFDQTVPALTESSNNLYELIKSASLRVYPDRELRQSVGWCVAKEGPRGWRIAKEIRSAEIDVVVALSFACLASIKYGRSWFEMHESAGGGRNGADFYER